MRLLTLSVVGIIILLPSFSRSDESKSTSTSCPSGFTEHVRRWNQISPHPSHDGSDINLHADECRAVLGPIPKVDCREGKVIPTRLQGREVSYRNGKFYLQNEGGTEEKEVPEIKVTTKVLRNAQGKPTEEVRQASDGKLITRDAKGQLFVHEKELSGKDAGHGVPLVGIPVEYENNGNSSTSKTIKYCDSPSKVDGCDLYTRTQRIKVGSTEWVYLCRRGSVAEKDSPN